MAEAAVFGIAKSVLKQLGSPALDEFRLLWGYKEDLEKLEDTLKTIQNVLRDADRRQATEEAVRGWLARLRVVLYDADDFFDAISSKLLLEKKEQKGTKIGKKVRHFARKPYRFASLVKNAHKVKEIRDRFDDIARDINKFNFLPPKTEQDRICGIGREETHSFVLRNDVIGREQETEHVVSLLLSDSSQEQISGVSVIAVIGIGGLGKTTLAKLVYNDERVQKGFDLCMWACIDYFKDLKQVLIALPKSAAIKSEHKVGETPPEGLNIEELQFKFRKQIEKKRFLLILDDVWDEEHQNWLNLKPILSSEKVGSKVLTTTRSESVAGSLCAIKPYFQLKEMNNESAWLLFKKVAFGEAGDQNSLEFEDIGRQIVRKCANVPLAIITIASLLREKEKEKWVPLLNDELSKVVNHEEYKKITQVLEFSYKELLYQVKRCFGYCSLFPKNYKFDKDSLVRLWIAQGFVEPLANQSLEDRAEDYFFYLVKRCFFQLATGDKETESIVAYEMHDLMHDLALEVAGSECILVYQSDDSSWDKTVHHVSMDCESYTTQSTIVGRVCSFSHSKRLRTFLYSGHICLGNDYLKKLMLAFRSLRVLDLSSMEIWEVPTSIGVLIHLQFLDLSKNYMKRLPRSICSLLHLQYLILRGCRQLKVLPEELGDLVSLRHLVLQGCDSLVKMPPGLAVLTSLVTLDKLVVHSPSGRLRYLEGLDNLAGSLQIELPPTVWESATTDLEKSSLSRKTRLHSLAISGVCNPFEDLESSHCQLPPNLRDLSIDQFWGKEMRNGISSLHKLVILKFRRCKSVALPPLSHLPSLKELFISDMDSMLTIDDSNVYEHSLFFPSLETLLIEKMPNLKSWWLEAPTVLPTFPRLTRVTISCCFNLTGCMPLFPLVEYLSLTYVREEIMLKITSSEATSGIVEVRKTDFPRVRHLTIPAINRNLFKGLKGMAFLEKLIITDNFNTELQEEDEEVIRWKELCKLHGVVLNFGEGFSMRNNQRLLNGFQDLTSLKYLYLNNCKELYLSRRMLLSLPHLEDVMIDHVEEVIDVDSEFATQPSSRCIQELSIRGCSGGWVHDIPWKSLPSLERLWLEKIRNLKSLPEGIQHLSTLENLVIYEIPSVVSLPHWMSSLPSLRTLDISCSSSELKKRCKKETGEDWPIIQHIPFIIYAMDDGTSLSELAYYCTPAKLLCAICCMVCHACCC